MPTGRDPNKKSKDFRRKKLLDEMGIPKRAKLEKADQPVPVTGTSSPKKKKKNLDKMAYDAKDDGQRDEAREPDVEIAEAIEMAKNTKKKQKNKY